MEKIYCDRNWLYTHYIVQKESIKAVAKEAKCVYSTVHVWLHKYEIPVRSRGEGLSLAKGNSVIITPALLEFMGGEILGDGYVGTASSYSARYQHSSKYEKYLIWLSGCLAERGIGQVGRIRGYKDEETGAITYQYESRSYPELVSIRQRWYPNGKKIVPQDLKLTPIMVRQWYLGDGSLAHPKRERPFIEFNTQGFDKESVEYLVKELGRLSFIATRQPSTNKIHLSVHSVQAFLKWIGPCPIACYDYKWDY